MEKWSSKKGGWGGNKEEGKTGEESVGVGPQCLLTFQAAALSVRPDCWALQE